MLNLDFSDDVPMHDAPLERQSAVAAREGALLVNAFEGSVPVSAERAAAVVCSDGVAAVESVVEAGTASALREHVSRSRSNVERLCPRVSRLTRARICRSIENNNKNLSLAAAGERPAAST